MRSIVVIAIATLILFIAGFIASVYLLLTSRETTWTSARTSLKAANVVLATQNAVDTTSALAPGSMQWLQTLTQEAWILKWNTQIDDPQNSGDKLNVPIVSATDRRKYRSFSLENSLPLINQRPAQGLGWLSISPDGRILTSSINNGAASPVQYTFMQNDQLKQFMYMPYTTDLPLKQKPIYSIGCNGFRAMEMSVDGLRLYIAYEVTKPDNQTDTLEYPFDWTLGRVDVFKRSADGFTQINGYPTTNATDWTYMTTLSNPFASIMFGKSNPYSALPIMSDMFGSFMRTTVHPITLHRVISIGSMRSFWEKNGAAIYTFEELGNGVYHIMDVLDFGDGSLDNGQVFAQQGLTLLVSRFTLNTVTSYDYSLTDEKWTSTAFIEGPLNANFGSSIELMPDTLTALIGAPTDDNGRGSVYMYRRPDVNSSFWSSVQKVQFPSADIKGFGNWIRADPTMRLFYISANGIVPTRSTSILPPADDYKAPKSDGMTGLLVGWTKDKSKLDDGSAMQIPFRNNNTSSASYADPTYGASTTLVIRDLKNAILAVPSPANQWIDVYTISLNLAS